ncbi:PREDICTED: immunoglobulin omega chain-like [Odobenus rosmarus divergens]
MAWIPVLLVFLSHGTICVCGHLSRPVLTRPPSLPATLEATDGLTCTLSRDIGVGGSDIYWIQQRPGSPPWDLLRFSSDSDKHQGSGVPGRFSGSKDASANVGLLCILGLQAEAEADSHWAVVLGSGRSYRSSQRLRQRGSETETPGPFSLVLFIEKLLWGFLSGVCQCGTKHSDRDT